MISLDQVKLLESKVTKAIDYVKKVTEENHSLRGKLDSYQNRIQELEVLIQQFKEEQSRIEDGILSALDRLNQFEDALEKTLAQEIVPAKSNASSKKDTPAASPPSVKEEEDVSSATETSPCEPQAEVNPEEAEAEPEEVADESAEAESEPEEAADEPDNRTAKSSEELDIF